MGLHVLVVSVFGRESLNSPGEKVDPGKRVHMSAFHSMIGQMILGAMQAIRLKRECDYEDTDLPYLTISSKERLDL